MEDRQLEQIEGTIEDIIFENSDSGYVVFELSGEGRLTVVCGTLGELHVGQSVICRGRYENHATYGRQFHAAECLTDMPKDIDAVYAFLASRSLPYVGPATARKIIETFGASALDVIANDPARLTQIKGISADKADRIQQEFKRMFGMRELIAYLAQFEIGPRRAMEVFRAFGPGAVQAVASNPYLLCGEPLQLDFRHADSIAAYYQMEGDSPQRLEAALLRTLRHNAGNGHTCLPRERLVATASAFIHQPPEKLTAALEHCLETGQLETRTLSAGEYIWPPRRPSPPGWPPWPGGTSRPPATWTRTSRSWRRPRALPTPPSSGRPSARPSPRTAWCSPAGPAPARPPPSRRC